MICFRYVRQRFGVAGLAGTHSGQEVGHHYSSFGAASTSAMNFSCLPCSKSDRRAGCRSRLAMFTRCRTDLALRLVQGPLPLLQPRICLIDMKWAPFRLRTILQCRIGGIAVKR